MINSETHVFRVGNKWKLMMGAFIVATLAQWFLAYHSFTRSVDAYPSDESVVAWSRVAQAFLCTGISAALVWLHRITSLRVTEKGVTVVEGRRQNYFPFVGSELIQGERQLFCRQGDWILTSSDGSRLNLSQCSCSSPR